MKPKHRILPYVFFAAVSVLAYSAEPPALAVMEFKTRSVSTDESLLVTDMLTSSMFRTGAFTVIDRSMRDNLITEIQYSVSDAADEKSQISLGKQLSADFILAGSLGRYDRKIVISTKILETESGRVVAVDDEVLGSIDEVVRMTDAIAERLVRNGRFVAGPVPEAVESTASDNPGTRTVAALEPDPVPYSRIDRFPVQLAFFSPVQLVPSTTEITAFRLNVGYGVNERVNVCDIGLVNIVEDRMNGFEIGIVNFTGEMNGFQVGLLNRSVELSGLQVGAVGLAGSVNIGQANLFLNVSDALNGLQMGIVNISEKTSGVQFGLVNISGLLRGVQIGLVNIIRYGENARFMPIVNFSY